VFRSVLHFKGEEQATESIRVYRVYIYIYTHIYEVACHVCVRAYELLFQCINRYSEETRKVSE
jgi:hypothetical protein